MIAFISNRGVRNNLWMMPATGGEPTLVLRNGVRVWQEFAWSPDGNQIYFKVRSPTREESLWELSVAGGSIRLLIDLKGRYGSLEPDGLATDGQYLYFPWEEDTGDLWVMDVEREN